MPEPTLGDRIRARRLSIKMAQSALAKAVGVSPAYINLIEHNRRTIGGKALSRIAEALNLPLDALSGEREQRLNQGLQEIPRGRLGPDLTPDSVKRLIAHAPEWAEAALRLNRLYREAAARADALSDRLNHDPELMALSHRILTQITAIRSFADILSQTRDLSETERGRFAGVIAAQSEDLSTAAREMLGLLETAEDDPNERALPPAEEVEDFLIEHQNHFPTLEAAAAAERKAMRQDEALLLAPALRARLEGPHAVAVRFCDAIPGGPDPLTYAAVDARFDLQARTLWLRRESPEGSIRFRMAQTLAELSLEAAVSDLIDPQRLTSPEARRRARRALARYAAAAMLFPYEPFLEAAETLRYDVDRLGGRFGAGFEQICHRLATLRRPGAAGIPFAMLRVDPAGAVSKRFRGPDAPMPRNAGGCPLWAVYAALAAPGRTIAQLAETPDGARLLFIARRCERGPAGFGVPASVYGVTLACEAVHAERTVYGGSIAEAPAKVGYSCRACARPDCAQRAHPPVFAPRAESG